MTTPDDTVTLTFAAHDLPSEFRPEVESVLRGLVPVVTSRVKARRRERLEQLVDVLITESAFGIEIDREPLYEGKHLDALLTLAEHLGITQVIGL